MARGLSLREQAIGRLISNFDPPSIRRVQAFFEGVQLQSLIMKSFAVLFLFFVMILMGRPALGGEDQRPNVVLIISDDQGFTDYGFMGSKIAKTPNLDRMVAESLLYTRGYVMPVCSPSLASLLTGQLPHVHGITGNDLGDESIVEEEAKGKMDRSPLTNRLLDNSDRQAVECHGKRSGFHRWND